MTATLRLTPDSVNSPSPITATAACYATNITPRSACSTRTPSNNSWSLLNLARNRHHHHWRFPHRRRHQPRYEQGLHRLGPKPHPPTHRRYPRLPRPVHASHSASGQKRNQIRLFLRNLAKHDRKRRPPLRTSTHPGDAYRSLSIHGVPNQAKMCNDLETRQLTATCPTATCSAGRSPRSPVHPELRRAAVELPPRSAPSVELFPLSEPQAPPRLFTLSLEESVIFVGSPLTPVQSALPKHSP
jgi:hypothetical protein